jgi:hypothetical protein
VQIAQPQFASASVRSIAPMLTGVMGESGLEREARITPSGVEKWRGRG